MPHFCRIPICDSKSIALCRCCNQHLCRSHFIQHDSLLRSKINVFTEEIDELSGQLQTLDVNKVTNDFLRKLDEWRFNSYRMIDHFYEKKCDELYYHIHQLLNKSEDAIIQLRFKLAKMVNVQQITEKNLKKLTSDIQILQQQINRNKHISIEFDINPLVIEDHLINIHLSKPQNFDFSGLTSPYQRIARTPFSSDAIASSEQYLLLHQSSNLYLIDENLFVVNAKKWPSGWIKDMCWSQTLNGFFLITFDDLYLVERETLTIKHIKTIEDESWQSCTCSNTCLYLSKDSWNSPIDEFSLKPSIEFIQHRERLETKYQKQRIDSIVYHKETLALAINDQSKQQIFIELRSITTFDRLWLCHFPIEYNGRKMQCCSLNSHAWLVTDWETSSIFHITQDGNVEDVIKYSDATHHITFFGTKKLVVSTNDSINFHQL